MKMLSTSRGVVVALLLGVMCATHVHAQDPDKEIVRRDRTIDNLIRSIDGIVWSNIVIYELKGEFLTQLVQSMQVSVEGRNFRVRELRQVVAR